MNKLITSLVAAFALASSAHAAAITFDLQGRSGIGMRFNNENPASASGSGTGGKILSGIIYDTVSKILTLNVGWGSGKGFTDLTGAVTAAHIHAAPDALLTSSGAVIINLDGATVGFNASGTNGGWTNTTVTLTAPQETQLLAGQLYLNAHTAANGGGEIRGNLVQSVPEPASAGLLGFGTLLLAARRKRTAQA